MGRNNESSLPFSRARIPRAEVSCHQHEILFRIDKLSQGRALELVVKSVRQSPNGLNQRLLKLELAGLVRSAQSLWWDPS